MNAHHIGQQIIRCVLAIVVVALPLTGLAGVWLFCAIAGAWIAYEGVDSPLRYWFGALLVVIEIVYGIGLGTLSLAYGIVVVLIKGAGRLLALTPLAQARDWGGIILFQAVVIAWIGALVMAALSAVVGALAYHQAHLAVRLGMLVGGHTLAVYGIGVLVVLLILRWVDTPWRRQL